MHTSLRLLLVPAVTIGAYLLLTPSASASGHVDASTLVTVPLGTFNGVRYLRHEAMFEGVTRQQRPYRVPCQIIAPAEPSRGSGLLLFDWLVASTAFTAVGQEQADARYTLTDSFLFGSGASYATVRCDPACIGLRSPVSDPARPWSDGLLDTRSEFITSAGDEFDIVADYVHALNSDCTASAILGQRSRTAAFAYSASGFKLRGLLRIPLGVGLFDYSLVGGAGLGFDYPDGNQIRHSSSERPPLGGAGREIDFQSESDVLALEAHRTRHQEANYRVYQFAGASHIRSVDAVVFGLPSALSANTADWTPFFRALLVAGNRWCEGLEPPPSVWLGAPNSDLIVRDARGNALVTYVGGAPVVTTGYRLPEVAIGENQYIPIDPSFYDGTFLGLLRMLAGGHVDLTGGIESHLAYVREVTARARELQSLGYLLAADADAIIARAVQSAIGS